MKKDISSNLNDIFEEEVPHKEKKESKREMKKKKRKEEKIEKLEDEQFLKLQQQEEVPELYLNTEEKAKSIKKKEPKKKPEVDSFFGNNTDFTTEQQAVTLSRLEKTRSMQPVSVETKKPTLLSVIYDTFFGFFLIVIFLVTIAYSGYSIYHATNLKGMLPAITLGLGICSYVISMTVKKEGIKKLFAILSSIGICAFIILTLYFS